MSQDESTGSQPPAGTITAHVAVKPPQFDEASANRWFQIVESQFIISRVTASSTKFHTIIADLPVKVLA